MEKELVMIGTARGARSGIAAVVNVYFEQGVFSRWRARYVATQADGGKLAKALLAARSALAFFLRLAMGRVGLLHVLAASDASFWRKSLFVLPAHVAGVPYVLHIHCGKYVAFFQRSAPWVQRLIRFQFRRARAVVALSDEWRGALGELEPAARVLSIPNPIRLPAWQASLEGSPPTVLYLGMLKEAKGVWDLLHAWPTVLRAVPDARLVLGGSGDAAAARAIAQRLGIEHSVRLPGWVVDEAKEALVREAWVFTLPSHAEALPMSILECMAAGLPVVASRVGGIPLAVEDGATGLLVEPRDVEGLARSLVAVLTDPARRREMGRAGRRRAEERFSAEVLVPRIEALWRTIAPQLELSPAPPPGAKWERRPRPA